MNRIKFSVLVVVVSFISSIVSAQTIDEGKKFLYHERFNSAKGVFEKLVAANPADAAAVYYLGQSYIGLEDIAAAKAVYQKALMANPNSGPLLIAGMGHIELLEGKTQDARNRFETAISLSQGKDAAVLNAVGFANIDAKKGDAAYAVGKLKLATELKKMKDPEVFANLGDAYRKAGEGGNAQLAYQGALGLDPNYARALYRIGKMYQTQGVTQKDIYLKYYEDALAKDPAYAPAYYNLHDYYYSTDVGLSAQYLEKYLANSDNDPKACYYRASMKYAQGLFAESITKADECIAGAAQPYPNLYAIKSYAYDKLGDSVKAKAEMDTYFTKQNPDKIGGNEYVKYSNILLKFPGNDSLAGVYVDKAVELDSIEANKVTYLKSMASFYETKKDFDTSAIWYEKIVNIKQNPSKTDLYYAGYYYFRGGKYQESIKVFDQYIQKFPEDAFGYYMQGKSFWGIDSTMSQGLANPSFEKAIVVGSVDSVKYKAQLVGSYEYLVGYTATIKKDKALALTYVEKILALDPANVNALKNKELLSAAPARRSGGK